MLHALCAQPLHARKIPRQTAYGRLGDIWGLDDSIGQTVLYLLIAQKYKFFAKNHPDITVMPCFFANFVAKIL